MHTDTHTQAGHPWNLPRSAYEYHEIERSFWQAAKGGSRSAVTGIYDGDRMIPAQSLGCYASEDGWHYAFATSNHGEHYEEFPISVLGFDY